jgi:hypothetical protein
MHQMIKAVGVRVHGLAFLVGLSLAQAQTDPLPSWSRNLI